MIHAILTDIEGTTTALSFVKEVLFPYAREHMADFVRNHHSEPEVAKLLDDVRTLARQPNMTLDEVITQLIKWIDEDKKITPLKALQGLLWEAGYKNGDYHGHVYHDAEVALRKWQAAGYPLYVYSSGSVYAQKLLFGHTEAGDMTPLFSGYFDTNVGAKTEADSYRNISNELKLPADEILFLSDVEAELDAAREAGMKTRWLMREHTANAGASHMQASDFSEIDPDSL